MKDILLAKSKNVWEKMSTQQTTVVWIADPEKIEELLWNNDYMNFIILHFVLDVKCC